MNNLSEKTFEYGYLVRLVDDLERIEHDYAVATKDRSTTATEIVNLGIKLDRARVLVAMQCQHMRRTGTLKAVQS